MYCTRCGKEIPDDAVVCVGCGRAVTPLYSPGAPPAGIPIGHPSVQDFAGKKIAAGVCALLLGSLGIHKFVLGLVLPGIIMLLTTILTCGIGAFPMHVIGLIEGIMYLTKSDDEFYRLYAIEKRGWF
jgi:TM2 domain-containing membrane protein YozV